MNEAALNFLKKHGMAPERVDPAKEAAKMAEDMRKTLSGQGGSMAMIPTYLRAGGTIRPGETAIIIDAGGTNFRRALVRFQERGCTVEQLRTWKMPGIAAPATWEEFIGFTADAIMPLLDKASCVGFCFSYSAQITPQIDGRVVCIDKEVVITGAEGQLVGASLNRELKHRGAGEKRVVVLNDTAAVLLGGLAQCAEEDFGGFIGQVSGTGTNTCCVLSAKQSGRAADGEGRIVNTESGMYDGIPAGDFDWMLDRASHDPGRKRFEKQTAGVYLGELCRLMLLSAAEEGPLSPAAGEKVRALGRIDSAVIDRWAAGEGLEELEASEADGTFVRALALALFERSARCMCANIGALLLLTDGGKDPARPVCVCAEGSLVEKSRFYRPQLERLLRESLGEGLGRWAVLRPVREATIAGSAAAALLNR